jgi:hypothetical protein
MIRSRFSAPLAAALAGLLAVSAGCSGRSVTYADAVEGTLTLDGVPVPNALVEFVPDVPEGTKVAHSSGVTDAKGVFQLTRNDNQRPGAAVGPHFVVVIPGRAAQDRDDPNGPDRSATSQVPAVYMKAAQTPLTVEVTKEPKTYKLDMSRTARPR